MDYLRRQMYENQYVWAEALATISGMLILADVFYLHFGWYLYLVAVFVLALMWGYSARRQVRKSRERTAETDENPEEERSV